MPRICGAAVGSSQHYYKSRLGKQRARRGREDYSGTYIPVGTHALPTAALRTPSAHRDIPTKPQSATPVSREGMRLVSLDNPHYASIRDCHSPAPPVSVSVSMSTRDDRSKYDTKQDLCCGLRRAEDVEATGAGAGAGAATSELRTAVLSATRVTRVIPELRVFVILSVALPGRESTDAEEGTKEGVFAGYLVPRSYYCRCWSCWSCWSCWLW
ncbi:hypothetical protein BZA05DRAFT_268355 [Tricharina praecox]|uniref:uncharacterized protein n=1 Tax=Tricharina praecox TaxID=43433 RepID=UPI0022207143|nr:uncharacterized protein BZA05DRAFT_268355 [Tricharina praecox]KAI5853730.1 hypothetical protein BZA05DRAFT_268355 [Tricharina praecox]